MENKIKKLEEHLNFIWDLIPNKPTYGEFNKIFPIDDNVEMLRNFEKEHNWFLIARYDTKDEGVSILSMFANITDFLTDGWRLSFEVEGENPTPLADRHITGFKMIKLD
jgi:hypothetical protein